MYRCGLFAMHAKFTWPPLNPVRNLDAPPPPNTLQMKHSLLKYTFIEGK